MHCKGSFFLTFGHPVDFENVRGDPQTGDRVGGDDVWRDSARQGRGGSQVHSTLSYSRRREEGQDLQCCVHAGKEEVEGEILASFEEKG